jgi:peptide deformylase
MGDPRLLQVSAPATEFNSRALDTLVADLLETMLAAQGAGLAAPQVGELQRVVIFGGAPSPRYPDRETVPYTVLINPVLEPLGEAMDEDWEGCLSVPGMRGWVPRYSALRYRGFDKHGVPIDRSVQGFHARVVQHEVDHLDGVLYPRRIRDLTKFGFNEELFPGQELVDD